MLKIKKVIEIVHIKYKRNDYLLSFKHIIFSNFSSSIRHSEISNNFLHESQII